MHKLTNTLAIAVAVVLLAPSAAFGYLHLANSRDALRGWPGDNDIGAALSPYSLFGWESYYRYSDSRIRNRVHYGPGYQCYAVFESVGSDSSISDYLIKNVCVA